MAKLSYDQLFVEKLMTASLSKNCIASLNLNMAIVSFIDLFVFLPRHAREVFIGKLIKIRWLGFKEDQACNISTPFFFVLAIIY